MKTAIIVLAFTLFGTLTFGQQIKNIITQPAVGDTSKIYKPDPNRIYYIGLTSDQLISLLQTSQAGVMPYLKTVKLPMDKLDNAQQYFNAIALSLANQYRRQYLADSLNTIKPKK